MTSFPSEAELLDALNHNDELVHLCAESKISFEDFLIKYNNFYWSFPLDGHESDQSGLSVLAKYSSRIALHKVIAETILSKICSEADALKESYKIEGRFGSSEAIARLKQVAANPHPI